MKTNLNFNFILFLIVLPSMALANVDPRLNEFFKGKTSIKNPAAMRDPFKAPLLKTQTAAQIAAIRTSLSNIPEIPKFKISELSIVGVLIGEQRKAIAKVGTSTNTFILTEGMKIGENNAELKAILPGGIVLVEKITNVYGQEEYLETVIPISK